ncbi:hypothetical protein Mal64_06460 [Pseudobythopirellula maris]|uniref:Carboxypeptidase regulatory-like domain-containing protein n=1 Tax=Pseudobythopirellula maris TaxID=2527991 RepID=A0A5C5ZTS9_9BACT|nr:hypothetical protein [Pseudobythopirellula maris]TWT90261.1 hypothetical protein Mal64_06460 [Pseudobythopirellula maris]
MRNSIGLTAMALMFGVLAISGCGDGRPTRAPVTGRVLIDGQPLTVGTVKFVSSGVRSSVGQLDGEGRFSLTCYEKNDGVIPGTHRVRIAAKESIDENTVRWHAPKMYADESTSGIEVVVDEPTQDLVIELTWDGQEGPYVERL